MKVGSTQAKREGAIFGPLTFKRGKEFLAFFAQPVWSLDEFYSLCPFPVNKSYVFTKQGKQLDPEAPAYKAELAEFARKRWGYTVLKTLEPSGIEWDTVKLAEPKTWGNVEKELRDNLGHYEFAKLMRLVDEANGIDEAKLEENAESFFQQQARDRQENSQVDGVENSSNSVLVSDSE